MFWLLVNSTQVIIFQMFGFTKQFLVKSLWICCVVTKYIVKLKNTRKFCPYRFFVQENSPFDDFILCELNRGSNLKMFDFTPQFLVKSMYIWCIVTKYIIKLNYTRKFVQHWLFVHLNSFFFVLVPCQLNRSYNLKMFDFTQQFLVNSLEI